MTEEEAIERAVEALESDDGPTADEIISDLTNGEPFRFDSRWASLIRRVAREAWGEYGSSNAGLKQSVERENRRYRFYDRYASPGLRFLADLDRLEDTQGGD